MIRCSETAKIPEIRVAYSLKLFPDTNFKTEIPDMSWANTHVQEILDVWKP